MVASTIPEIQQTTNNQLAKLLLIVSYQYICHNEDLYDAT